jgi:hypothetical protein
MDRSTTPFTALPYEVFEHEHDDQLDALVEWLVLELVPSGIDHLAYLDYLLQKT